MPGEDLVIATAGLCWTVDSVPLNYSQQVGLPRTSRNGVRLNSLQPSNSKAAESSGRWATQP